MVIFRRRLACAFILLCGASPAWSATYKVLLSTDTILPGQTLRVELDGLNPAAPKRLVWGKRVYGFFSVGPNAQRALVGVPLGAAPGDAVLSVYPDPRPPKFPSEEQITIHIATKTYEVENINLPPEKTRLRRWEHAEATKIRRLARWVRRDQYWEGAFDPPVQGPQEAPFGLKRVHNQTEDAGFHNGIDLKAALGTKALAANSGIVVLAAAMKAHGRVVMIDHGQGVMTLYLHLQSILVKTGQKVTKGQPVGKVGSSGISTGPHIHWEVFVHGVPVDPQQWVETEF